MKIPCLDGSTEDFVPGAEIPFGVDIPAVGEFFMFENRERQRISLDFHKHNVRNIPAMTTQHYDLLLLTITLNARIHGSPKLGDQT